MNTCPIGCGVCRHNLQLIPSTNAFSSQLVSQWCVRHWACTQSEQKPWVMWSSPGMVWVKMETENTTHEGSNIHKNQYWFAHCLTPNFFSNMPTHNLTIFILQIGTKVHRRWKTIWIFIFFSILQLSWIHSTITYFQQLLYCHQVAFNSAYKEHLSFSTHISAV